jgi:hypothetical protein
MSPLAIRALITIRFCKILAVASLSLLMSACAQSGGVAHPGSVATSTAPTSAGIRKQSDRFLLASLDSNQLPATQYIMYIRLLQDGTIFSNQGLSELSWSDITDFARIARDRNGFVHQFYVVLIVQGGAIDSISAGNLFKVVQEVKHSVAVAGPEFSDRSHVFIMQNDLFDWKR